MVLPPGSAPAESWRVEIPAHPRHLGPVRTGLRRWLRAHRIPDSLLHDVLLVGTEALSNSVVHAYRAAAAPGTASLTAAVTPAGAVRLTVTDHGTWRPPAPDGHHGLGGRGLRLIRALADKVTLTHDPTTLTALLLRSAAPRPT